MKNSLGILSAVVWLLTNISHVYAADLKQVALVIGNGAYEYVRQLKNPPVDAGLVAKRLAEVGYELVGGNVHVDVNRKEFKALLALFLSVAKTADVAFFYYSGHAVQINGENYLIPIDNDADTEDDLEVQAIAAANFIDVLGKVSTKLNFFILDACRDNPFLEKETYAATKSLDKQSVGLASMDAPPATVIWFATSPGKKASDAGQNGGPYANAIFKYMAISELNIYDFFNRSGLEVFIKTEKKQTPWLHSSPILGSYFFRGRKGKSIFVPYEFDETAAATPSLAAQLFRSGINTAGSDFEFGMNYEKINSLLDSSFQIDSWESLPEAGEFVGDEVRYFWVYLSGLPSVQSMLAQLGADANVCIDPTSYIVFFFNKREFFRSSIRLAKGSTCANYNWIKDKLFTDGKVNLDIEYNGRSVEISFKEGSDYYFIDVVENDIVDKPVDIFGIKE